MSYEKFAELEKMASDYAEAEAQRVYLTEFKKSKKAIIMKMVEPTVKTTAGQEREAYAHEEYLELIDALKIATEKALKLKFQMEVLKIKFETWRTKQATLRAEMNMQ
jgi:hypothetical protein